MTAPEGFVWAMSADDLAEGSIFPFSVDGDERIIVMTEGEVFALDGICTHEYAELWDGEVEDDTLWCPLHSSGFNVRTGAVTNLPAVIPLKTYDVRIEDGTVYVSREPKDQE